VNFGGTRQFSILTPILTPVEEVRPAHDYQCGGGEQSLNWNFLCVVKQEETVSSVAVENTSDVVSPGWMLVKGVKRQLLDSPPMKNCSVDIYELRLQRCIIRKQRSVDGREILHDINTYNTKWLCDGYIHERERSDEVWWSGDAHIHGRERSGDIYIFMRERGTIHIHEMELAGDVTIYERAQSGVAHIHERERSGDVHIHGRERLDDIYS